MSAYIIAHVQVTNPVQYEESKKWFMAAIMRMVAVEGV